MSNYQDKRKAAAEHNARYEQEKADEEQAEEQRLSHYTGQRGSARYALMAALVGSAYLSATEKGK